MLGYSLVFLLSWVFSANCVLNRALKGINSGVIMFWHGILGITLATIAVLTQYFVEDQPEGNSFHLFNMSWKLFGLMLAATMFDTLTVNAYTIAYQSDSSGFVALISYVVVIYAFLFDILIFDESFTWVELLAATSILVMTVLTSVVKLRESNKAKQLAVVQGDGYTRAEDSNQTIQKTN